MNFNEIQVGQRASVTKTITEADVILFAGVSLDVNPAHMNESYAETTFFKKRIAHGMLSAGLISAVLGTKLPGEGTVYLSQELNFTAPVYFGDTITAAAEVEQLIPEKKRIILNTVCTNQDGKEVIHGKATVSHK
ncbi:MAG: MaoC family dehydratase [Fusobacteriaceae bacterium]|jgi:3-hydroxybutyryl-CoA dehydratase|nr:MaoC family dehydratase [Fusobacteriaceae bacterium]